MSRHLPPVSLPPRGRGFTLVELMVATAILAVILLLVFKITQQTSDAWKSSAAKIESFQGARAAFEAMTRTISQATLNTYYDYFDKGWTKRTNSNASTFEPEKYGRYSDLHFISGKSLAPTQIGHSIFFQTPRGFAEDNAYRGMETTLNALGFFLEYTPDRTRPSFLGSLATAPAVKNRFRLMQFFQPTEALQVYNPNSSSPTSTIDWFKIPLALSTNPTDPAPLRPAFQVAENIVALVILPKRAKADENRKPAPPPLAPQYEYNSRPVPAAAGAPPAATGAQPVTENQLPPLVEVVMVAVDEPSFSRFNNPTVAPDFGVTPSPGKLFTQAADLDTDLQILEDNLLANQDNKANNKIKLRYQVFRTDVPIRAAKWSE